MQLDIFEHSRAVMLRNDVLQALEQRRADAATNARRALAHEFAADPALPAFDALIAAIESISGTAFADHAELRRARLVLEGGTEPAAHRLFGLSAGAAWAVPLWRRLALRAAPLAFRADAPDDHAAPLWLRAGDWAAAAEATGRIESWRRIPAPLGFMVEARQRADGLNATWPLWAELAWLAPARFDALARRLADPIMAALRKRFDAVFEGAGDASDLAWFPAWVLTEDAGAARWLAGVQPSLQQPPETALHLLLELLGLERQGRQRDVIDRRRRLRDLHASLYASYLRTR